ncbi:hypothetical protein KSP40_PGU021352 [Platanthera guangdongensis]|uniref:Uncharacterized protein n=1 Tax=Platanthera guangdongensis TaxID=2320717 RepID=A0ABR2MHY2_9ASPA
MSRQLIAKNKLPFPFGTRGCTTGFQATEKKDIGARQHTWEEQEAEKDKEKEREALMAGERDADEEIRSKMMQNLFGDQSEEEDDEEDVDSEHEAAANQSDYPSVQSELEAHDIDLEHAESEGGRVQSSPEREVSDDRAESEGKFAESEEEGYGQRAATSRRREFAIESEGSEGNYYARPNNLDDEVNNARNISSPDEQKDNEVVRDVFGDSDEDDREEYGVQKDLEQNLHRSPLEEEEGGYDKDLKPEDIILDEDAQYEFDDENLEQKTKEKPIGPPVEMDIPLHPPPGRPDQASYYGIWSWKGLDQDLDCVAAEENDPKSEGATT